MTNELSLKVEMFKSIANSTLRFDFRRNLRKHLASSLRVVSLKTPSELETFLVEGFLFERNIYRQV